MTRLLYSQANCPECHLFCNDAIARCFRRIALRSGPAHFFQQGVVLRLKQTFISSFLFFSLFLSGSASAAFDQYTVTDLGSLDPVANDYSYAFDINDGGDIVGFSKGTDGLDHAFVRLRGQSLTDLGQGRATSINNRRQFVGWGSGPNYLLWKENGAGNWMPEDMGVSLLENGWRGQLIKINDRGHAAGTGYNQSVGDHVFFWKDGIETFLAYFPGCIPLSVVGFNNSDDVLFGDASSMHIFHGTTEQQEVLGDGSFAELNALNDAGEAVGLVSMFGAHGYYSASTGFLDPSTTLSLWDINNSGLAVGGGIYGSYGVTFEIPSKARAFIYSPQENSVTYLDTLIPDSGWNFKIATAINDAGQIVGVGINPSGKTHAFLLTPTGQP